MLSSALIKEITDTGTFLTSRSNISDNGPSAVALRQNLSQQMATMVTQLKSFSPSDANSLIQACAGNPYGPECTERVVAAVDARLASVSTSGSKGSLTPQRLKTPWNYLTKDDWDVLANPKIPMHAKMSVCVTRSNLVGCTHPHEQTVRQWIALICLSAFTDLPSHHEIYKLVNDYKASAEAGRKPHAFSHRLVYPDHPSELPSCVFAYAYTTDNPPHPIALTGIEDVAKNHVPLRKNSKPLKQATPAIPTSRLQILDLLKELVSVVSADPRITLTDSSDGKRCLVQRRAALGDVRRRSRNALCDESPPRGYPPRGSPPRDFDARSASPTPTPSPATPPPAHHNHERSGLRFGGVARGRSFGSSCACDLVVPPEKAEPPAPASAEPPVPVKPEEPDIPAAPAAKSHPDASDLNDYQRAAIAAMTTRKVTKAEEQKAARAEKADLKKAEKLAALALKPSKRVQRAAAKKAAAHPLLKRPLADADACKRNPDAVLVKSNAAPMPRPPAGADAPPHDYKSGRIYYKRSSRTFRVIRLRGVYKTERKVQWSDCDPSPSEWKAALKLIDDYKPPK